MKIFLAIILIVSFQYSIGQTSGTIKIDKNAEPHPVVKFMGKENGSISIKPFEEGSCLEPNLGEITNFELVAEDKKGNWLWIQCDSSCLNKENYEQLQKLGNGTQIEFINLKGTNSNGKAIIFPGMKFVVRKKS